MWDNIIKFFKNLNKKEEDDKSKRAAKERLHLVLMQDRANVSADFLELMKQEIIDVIKKYIEVDENEIDVRLTNKTNTDGTTGAPALYANIPIMSLKSEAKKASNEVIKREEEIKKATEQAAKKEEMLKKAKEKKAEKLKNKEEMKKIKQNTKTLKNMSSTQKTNGDNIENNGEVKESKTAAAKAATKAAFDRMTSKIKSMQK